MKLQMSHCIGAGPMHLRLKTITIVGFMTGRPHSDYWLLPVSPRTPSIERKIVVVRRRKVEMVLGPTAVSRSDFRHPLEGFVG